MTASRQLALARLPISQLRAVFITHQHSDHNAGYGALWLLGWLACRPAGREVRDPALRDQRRP